MKVHSTVQKSAWAGMVMIVAVGLITAISGVVNPYNNMDIILALLVLMIMALPLTLLLYPAKSEVEERVRYKYADERAPEGFDTQA